MSPPVSPICPKLILLFMSFFFEVVAAGLEGLREGGSALLEQAELLEGCVIAMGRERRALLAECKSPVAESSLQALIGHERQQLKLLGDAAEGLKRLRVAALRLEGLAPLLQTGTLPSSRKEPSSDAKPNPRGMLSELIPLLERLGAMEERSAEVRLSLYDELNLREVDAKAAASSRSKKGGAKDAKDAAAKRAAAAPPPKRGTDQGGDAPAKKQRHAGSYVPSLAPPAQGDAPPMLTPMPQPMPCPLPMHALLGASETPLEEVGGERGEAAGENGLSLTADEQGL